MRQKPMGQKQQSRIHTPTDPYTHTEAHTHIVRVLGEKWEKVEGGKNPVQAFGSLASISWHSLPPDSIPSEATKTGYKTPQK